MTVSATTDRRAGLQDCDAILTSYRPGGFEARVLDEKIPLRHGVIGQETQGPGGFFMALRSIAVMQGVLEDVAVSCPGARIFNYTNPVNIVAQAVTDHSDVPFVSLCEGPILYPEMIAEAAGLDPARLDVASVGLNHGSWSVRHSYDGQDIVPLLQEAWARRRDDPDLDPRARRMLRLATVMGALPSEYFQYYYFEDEVLGELQAQADDPRGGHPLLGPGLLGALRRGGRERPAGARPGPLARRHPRARARDRLHGRRLQRPRRDPPGQRPQPGLDPRLPRHARRGDAGPLRRERDHRARDARACRRTSRASSRRSPSISRRRPTPRGRAMRATASGRSPRTRSCARSTWRSASTRSSRPRIATTCRRGSSRRSLHRR